MLTSLSSAGLAESDFPSVIVAVLQYFERNSLMYDIHKTSLIIWFGRSRMVDIASEPRLLQACKQ
uniref:Uncharacterized protein n=1 Tax=Physcomitrium patens TaxID=3218 RepID=A0A7I4DTK7_PHYPA